MIDNATLIIAVGFSGCTLLVTLLINWIQERKDNYLVSWAAGMAFAVLGLAIIGLRGDRFDLTIQISAWSSLILAMALIYAGACQFRQGRARSRLTIGLWVAAMLATNVPFLLGYNGVSVIALNFSCALFMLLAGYQYLAARAEAPMLLTSTALLYGLTGLSFLACGIVPLIDGVFVLDGPPNNWAEQFNSIMNLIGITGIGALSLTLNQSRATRRHRQEALTDVLTGLLNRRALFDRFEAATLPAGTAVLMFDIDHFKQINDRRGHAAGDAVIKHFAEIIARSVRPEDPVARIGGEEFCAILPVMSIDQAKAIAERVRSDLDSGPVRLHGETLHATVSVGVATSNEGESFSSVLSRADGALYKAKGNGRNRVDVAALRLIA